LMKAQIQTKTRIQKLDWTIFRRPDEKTGCRDLVGETASGALTHNKPKSNHLYLARGIASQKKS
jgi:hypothetical protein